MGDLFDGVRTEALDLTAAFEALGVERRDGEAPLPRTAAKPRTPGRTSEEIAAASKDPALFEYVRRRDFGPRARPSPRPATGAAHGATRS